MVLLRELNNYTWQDNNSKPVDGFNHFLDAARYALQYLIQGVNSGKYVVR